MGVGEVSAPVGGGVEEPPGNPGPCEGPESESEAIVNSTKIT